MAMVFLMKSRALISYTLMLLAIFTVIGCSKQDGSSAPEQNSTASTSVTVILVQPQAVNIVENLPARIQAYRIAEIRPQVGGIIEKRLFQQGSEVKAGQPLFHINSAMFLADVNSAKAALEKTQAEANRLRVQLDRLKPLIVIQAISKQNYDDTEAQYKQAIADVSQAKANLARQNLNLQYATVRAPISGRIGQQLVSEGGLVSASDSNPMAIIQQIDRVYVDVKQSLHDLEMLQESLRSGEVEKNGQQRVQILDTQGKTYPVSGKILFSDLNVDQTTGDTTIRIEVDNPQRRLLPGMYVRASISRAFVPNAILVPEQAVARDEQGNAQLIVVNKNKTAEYRQVQLGQNYHNSYVINQGLKAGETVVVEGLERVMPGVPLHTMPWKPGTTSPVQSTLSDKQQAVTASMPEQSAIQRSGE